MMNQKKSWVFKTRWRIEGTLTSTTPFHVGSGTILDEGDPTQSSLSRRNAPRKESGPESGRFVEVSAVVTDHRGQAYLPATVLKGNLRAWLRARFPANAGQIDRIFGSENTNDPSAESGKAEFLDAFIIGNPPAHESIHFWDEARRTGIVPSVGIDRRTRTAVEKKLFHEEFVPPGVSFSVAITGQGLTDDDLALLLAALEGFNSGPDTGTQQPSIQAGRVTLGAVPHNGRGRFEWRLGSIRRLAKDGAAAWLAKHDAQGQPVIGYDGLDQVPRQDQEALDKKARGLLASLKPIAKLVIEIDLQFEGPFLVNDPRRAKPKDAPESDERANHAPRRDDQGRIILPARSFRGAFRSHAEKIVRTLRSDAGGDPHGPRENRCGPIRERGELGSLSLVAQLFGAPGWGAPIEFSDFVQIEDDRCLLTMRQEFVAIDRFTGGAAFGQKFNADFADRPCLSGTIGVDLDRIGPWSLGLLAVSLRDLIEGDITFGFGAAKGYGACRVIRLETIGAGSQPDVDFSELLPSTTERSNPAARERLDALVGEFRSAVESWGKENAGP